VRAGGRAALSGALLAVLALTACSMAVRPVTRTSAPVWPWVVSDTVADSVHTEVLSPAVRLHSLVSLAAPWRAAVLDVDLSACVSLRALKGGETAVGRRTTSALLEALAERGRPLAAVNADFFLFAPAGVPTGAHVEGGQLITGPGQRPVFALDASGQPFLGVLQAAGEVRGRLGTVALGAWNRPELATAGILDAAWGSAPDSTVGGRWRLLPVPNPDRASRSPAGWTAPFTLDDGGTDRAPSGDTLLLVRVSAADAPWMRAGDTVMVALRVGPVAPIEAVGGFPMLVANGELASGLETAGAASFRGLNPRTAIGVAAGGRRVLLAVVDGRQPGWSVGMTTEQTGRLMQALGAHDALNLDGGGSSALVLREAASGHARLATRPSDPTGERAVGNALAVVDACADVAVP